MNEQEVEKMREENAGLREALAISTNNEIAYARQLIPFLNDRGARLAARNADLEGELERAREGGAG